MKYALHEEEDLLEVVMEGGFSFMDSKSFMHVLKILRENTHIREIRFNIRMLMSIDSTAMGLLMRAFDIAKTAHRGLVFVSPRGQVQEALAMANAYNSFRMVA